MRGNSPFGRKATNDGWTDLGSRYERFESQPPVDDGGERAKLTFKQRAALRRIEVAIGDLSSGRQSHANSGRRTRTQLPTLDQHRYEKWWRGQVESILSKHQAAEASAQVIHLTPHTGERRAA